MTDYVSTDKHADDSTSLDSTSLDDVDTVAKLRLELAYVMSLAHSHALETEEVIAELQGEVRELREELRTYKRRRGRRQ